MNLGGFQSFVAWRYLMARPRRVSNLPLWLAIVFGASGAVYLLLAIYALGPPRPDAFPLASGIAEEVHITLYSGAALVMVGAIAALFALVELACGRRASRTPLWVAFIWLVAGVSNLWLSIGQLAQPGGGTAFDLLLGAAAALSLAALLALIGVRLAALRGKTTIIVLDVAGVAMVAIQQAGWSDWTLVPGGFLVLIGLAFMVPPRAAVHVVRALVVLALAAGVVGFELLPSRGTFALAIGGSGAAILIGILIATARVRADVDRPLAPVLRWIAAAIVLAGVGVIAYVFFAGKVPGARTLPAGVYYTLLAVGGGTLVFGVICAVFCVLRYYFTFFTTVPIGGVWIGVMALVVVLSVMSGFENDLQSKILGSNAHIQVTKTEPDEGDATPFTEWKDVEKKIDALPGVVASMPFVTSEAVIAANNNYATVIIKGIDPAKVGKVTRLVQDVEEHDKAMKRLLPEVKDELPRTPVAPPPPKGQGGVVDPAPDDMPGGAPPIDLSGGNVTVDPAPSDFGGPVTPPTPRDLSAPAPDEPVARPDYGGDARDLVPGAGSGSGTVHSIAIPLGSDSPDNAVVIDDEGPRDNGRTASLPGILVGRELVKTIHMYVGEEVRIVSPLSDPSNPDATGTPIPYNRDFRVAGIFYTGMYEYDLKFVYVPLDALQEFLDLGDAVDGIEVRLADPDATEEVGAAIARSLGNGYDVSDWKDWCPRCYELASRQFGSGYTIRDWKDLNRNLFSALKLEKIAMFLVLAITILVASFSIIGNLIMVVVEKAKEIALLKTLGAGDRGVMMLFVTQGFFIGVIGTALGVLGGLGLCWAASTWGLPLNPDVYYIDQLPISVEPGSVMAIAAAGILISVGATIYPAFVAARLRPAQGLRHD